jgi:hypothetical protein
MPNIPVKDADHWFRDSGSGSLQCSNKTEYEKYMAAYKSSKVKEGEFKTLQNEVSELKSELGDIKSLLLTLVQNKNHDS